VPLRVRLYRPDLMDQPEPVVSGEDFHYLAHVLRARPGFRCVLFGKRDEERDCEVAELGAKSLRLRVMGTKRGDTEPPFDLTLALAVGKGKKLEEVVEAATALGARRILPFVGEHSVARRENPKLTERLQTIAIEACRQSGRTCPPEVFPTAASLEEVLIRPDIQAGPLFLLDEAGGLDPIEAIASRGPMASAALFCGPEGGWSERERELLIGVGAIPISLGPRILRTELAAIAAVALLERLLSHEIKKGPNEAEGLK